MSGSPLGDGLMDAFWAYESALMSNDTAALDRLFVDAPTTMRVDGAGLLVGHDAISAFRAGRGQPPQRRIVETHVQFIDADHAVVLAITELLTGGRGAQTQVWSRKDGSWAVQAAHVSAAPAAFDRRVWRELGDPLVAGATQGPLAGESVAVKDLFAVAGHPIGAGNPAWLDAATSQSAHADAVALLLEAGATITGIARTDEFAFSLAGTNAHYGSPPNPRAPGRISGGSSSGSASAVAQGQATIGLGTDTGGSIRVPASYGGLWGIRTTHGAVPTAGLLPLAQSFDTVGWMTRSPDLLARVADVLIPREPGPPLDTIVVADSLLADVEDDVRNTLVGHLESLAAVHSVEHLTAAFSELPRWLLAFQTVQGHEAWQNHGPWLADRLDTLGPDVRARFERSRGYTDAEAEAGRAVLVEARAAIRSLLSSSTALLIPSASSVAPSEREATKGGPAFEALRATTLRLTCLAGIGGLPAVNVPLSGASGRPVGLCVIAPAGRDHALIELAATLAGQEPPQASFTC